MRKWLKGMPRKRRVRRPSVFDSTIFTPLASVSVVLNSSVDILVDFFTRPFSGLVTQANEIAEASLTSLGVPKTITWDYVADSATGLRVLKAEKKAEALDEIQQKAEILFK